MGVVHGAVFCAPGAFAVLAPGAPEVGIRCLDGPAGPAGVVLARVRDLAFATGRAQVSALLPDIPAVAQGCHRASYTLVAHLVIYQVFLGHTGGGDPW